MKAEEMVERLVRHKDCGLLNMSYGYDATVCEHQARGDTAEEAITEAARLALGVCRGAMYNALHDIARSEARTAEVVAICNDIGADNEVRELLAEIDKLRAKFQVPPLKDQSSVAEHVASADVHG